MRIDVIHRKIYSIARKESYGHLSPQDVDDALDEAQLDYYNNTEGDLGNYRPGRPLSRIAYNITQAVGDAYAPFLKTKTFTPSDLTVSASVYEDGGLLPFDKDYENFVAAYIVWRDFKPTEVGPKAVPFNRTSPVDILTEEQVAARLESQLLLPRLEYPFGVFEGQNDSQLRVLRIFPKEGFLEGKAFYLIRPPAPHYAYTQDGREITYDDASSTQMLWNDRHIQRIMLKALQYLGIELSDASLAQFGMVKDKEGAS